MTMTMAQQLIQKSREEGRKEGREQAHELNLITNRKLLVTMLRKKFNRVPKTIQDQILSIHDDIVLQSLIIGVMDCETIDEFREKLL